MKRSAKKLLALLLTIIMVVSLFPAVASAQPAAKEKGKTTEALSGYIPMTYHGSRALTEAYLRGDQAETNGTRATFPPAMTAETTATSPPSRTRTRTAPAGPSAPWPPSRPT